MAPQNDSKMHSKMESKWAPKFAHVSILIQNGVKMGAQNGTPKWDPSELEDRIFLQSKLGFGNKKTSRMELQMDPQMDPSKEGPFEIKTK